MTAPVSTVDLRISLLMPVDMRSVMVTKSTLMANGTHFF